MAASTEVFIDGASRGNPGPSGVGIVFMDGQGRPFREVAHYVGETTNNVAEYLALIYALQEAVRLGLKSLQVKTDSLLLASQMAGRYKVRNPELQRLHGIAKNLLKNFEACEIQHIPREQNKRADKQAGKGAARDGHSSTDWEMGERR